MAIIHLAGCVEKPDPVISGGEDMSNVADSGEVIDEKVARIEIVLDGATPGQEIETQQGGRLQLKVQGFDSSGRLVADNVIAQTTVLLQDMNETGLTEESILDRSPLVLSQNGNIIEVLERGRGRLTVSTANQTLTDSVVLNATKAASLTGALPQLTTLRKDEPLFLDESLVVETQPGVLLPLVSLCTQPGEVVAEGAIIIQAVESGSGLTSEDLTFSEVHQVIGSRTGIGKLKINCSALAEYRTPTQLEYTFRVKSATEVSSGDEHTCAMLRPQNASSAQPASDVLCWGKNERGQVGTLLNGKRQDVTSATTIFQANQGPIELSTGPEHTCALLAGDQFEQGTRSGEIRCWGDDRHGQTAPIDRENASNDTPSIDRPTLRSTPVSIDVAYMKFARICGGQDYSCALSDRGRLLCWGENSYGQLGQTTPIGERVTRPTELFPTQRYQELSCGAQHACGTTLGGESQCWGRNHLGQLGVSPDQTPLSDEPIVLAQDNVPFSFEELALGVHTSCGIQNDVLYCWGDNRIRQLTDFLPEKTLTTPTRINLSNRIGERVESIDIGKDHACAVTVMDTLDTNEEEACLVDVLDMQDFTLNAGNPSFTTVERGSCASRGPDNKAARDGWRSQAETPGTYTDCRTTRLYCWGDTRWGQIIKTDADRLDKPQELSCQAVPPSGIPANKTFDRGPNNALLNHDDFRTVTTGSTHSCAAGRTTVGKRAMETVDNPMPPVTVDTKEKVWCWGRSDNGKIGSRTTGIIAPSPESTFKQLGQSNDGDTFVDDRSRRIGQPREMAIGATHGCVRTCLPGNNPNKDPEDTCEDLFDAQHHVVCWGSNQQGQRGKVDGFEALTSPFESTPSAFQIERSTASKSNTIQRLVSGSGHLCTSYQSFERTSAAEPRINWTSNNSLRCWGKNSHQQAGASVGTSPHGNPGIGISGGPNTCQVVNFADRLGDLHTCGFTLRADFAKFFDPRYAQLDDERPEDRPYYDYATDIYACWDDYDIGEVPKRPGNTFNDLTFSAKGQPYCWGNGSLGQHGRGATVMADARPSPDRPAGNDSTYFYGMASSDFLNCGWRNFLATGFGEVQCWGADPSGLVKDWGDTPPEERLVFSPTRVEGWNTGDELRDRLKAIVIMAIGESHICVMSNPQNKYVLCWGDNTYGQIGGVGAPKVAARDAYFVKISENDELTEVVQLTAGHDHTCALTASQKLYCWGRNDRGQVGALDEFGNVSDNLYNIREPYEVRTFNDKYIKEIKAFNDHTCAMVADDIFENSPVSIHCWGANDLGQSACWDTALSQDPNSSVGEDVFCTSSTPWSRRPFITQAFP